jgi:hypothetical protein
MARSNNSRSNARAHSEAHAMINHAPHVVRVRPSTVEEAIDEALVVATVDAATRNLLIACMTDFVNLMLQDIESETRNNVGKDINAVRQRVVAKKPKV